MLVLHWLCDATQCLQSNLQRKSNALYEIG